MNFQELLVEYNMIKQEKRMFYPRNFNLSDSFLRALKSEVKTQQRSGVSPDVFAKKLIKAIQFHIDEINKQDKKPQ